MFRQFIANSPKLPLSSLPEKWFRVRFSHHYDRHTPNVTTPRERLARPHKKKQRSAWWAKCEDGSEMDSLKNRVQSNLSVTFLSSKTFADAPSVPSATRKKKKLPVFPPPNCTRLQHFLRVCSTATKAGLEFLFEETSRFTSPVRTTEEERRDEHPRGVTLSPTNAER